MAIVLKTVVGVSLPWVRIPPSPHVSYELLAIRFKFLYKIIIPYGK